MKRIVMTLIAVVLSFALQAQNARQKYDNEREMLWQSFLTPPDSIRVGCYYYWVNEHVDPKGVKADLQWMKDNGITLAFLATDIRNRTRWEKPWEGETFGKNKFQSRLWWENLRTALKTAGELGIEMGIFNCPGWSQSGGPWVKPDEAMRNWTPQGIEVCKTARGTDVMCGPCSDEAEGLEVDKLSKTHVKKHFEAFFGEILRRIAPEDRKTLTTVVVDSWERGKQNYTDSIYSLFRQRYGYELDYSQVIDPQSSMFNVQCSKDLDRLISDLVASEYMGGLTEKAHEYGLRTWCEPYAHSPFPGNSITYGSAADEVAAEFWVNDRKFRKKEVDAALGAARKSGKNRVWAESFTDGGWDRVAQDDWSFEKLKPIADRYFHAGINASILHVMISQPGDDREPAVRPWFGTFFDRRSQHATDLKPLVEYLRRCNFMLQLGQPYQGTTDQRILTDGTIIRFTEESLFEITFPDGRKETWNPMTSNEPRQDRLLDTGWVYRPMSDPRSNSVRSQDENPTVKDKQVTLPHTWNAQYTKGTEYNRETMVYMRKLTVTDDMLQGKRLFLRFEGVNSVADVFVNGITVGQHKGGYTAFCFEITDYLKAGENRLEVWVSNAFRTDVLPISGDFNVYGGIHRPVHLIITGKDCISPLFYGSSGVLIRQDKVTKEQAEVTVDTHLSASTNKRLRVTMTDAADKVVAQAETAVTSDVACLPLTIAKPVLWNGRRNPYRYTIKAELMGDDGTVLDCVEERTGLRYFSVDSEKGFLLNGESYPLYGFNRHEDVEGKGSALTKEDHDRDMQLIKETGATMIRLSHYPQSRYFYELADREGMVLWSEIPLCGPGGYDFTGYVANTQENARQVALEMIYQNFNRPSVCFWGLFNEILVNDGRFKAWDDPVPFIKELNALYKQTDPTRLTTFATCVPHEHYLGCSDLMAWNKYFRRPGNEASVRKFFEQAYQTSGGQPLGISEYGDAGSPNQHYDPRYDKARTHSETYQCITHEGYWRAIKDLDWLWCKTIWQFSDMQSSIRHEGDHDGRNDKGMVTYDRLEKKDIFYFYKAQWNPEPMVYITDRRFTNRKHPTVDVKVYTNQKAATLYVNGKKVARQLGDDIHRIIYKDVQLTEGENKIEVRAGMLSDECTWTLSEQ